MSSTTPVEQKAEALLSDTPEEEKTPRFPRKEESDNDDKSKFADDMLSPKDITTANPDPSASPLLTARRVAGFDEVQLSEKEQSESLESGQDDEGRGRTESISITNRADRSRSRSSVNGAGSTAPTPNLAASTWTQASKGMPAAMSRKFSSPFGWLSRKKTNPQGSTSPPAPMPRRHTAATASVSGKPDFMLSRLDEDKAIDGRPSGKEVLKERFKLLRMREEAGVDIDELPVGSRISATATTISLNGDSKSQSGDIGLGIKSDNAGEDLGDAASPPAENDISSPPPAAPLPVRTHTRNNSVTSSLNPNLAPGTVSGMQTGPSSMQDSELAVDWDLWQSLVYEGPTAVAKTSAAELNHAIAGGIPQAIRGVVWQILAGSKNEELEGVYRELVARGTDKELAPSPKPTTVQSAPVSANSLGSFGSTKESIVSSESSAQSLVSTPATTTGMISPSQSVTPQDAEPNTAKMEAAMAAERQKKAKDDLASLKKLEKTIRKDLGSRSNYSKYAAAAGLQDSLFGVCKAYALFDEGVGYAQGMNFIVMPLLFNVSLQCSTH